ncbi:MAG: hypothetical protein ACOX60_06375 [Massiliimalia sp.]|jgi:hypothetical protein
MADIIYKKYSVNYVFSDGNGLEIMFSDGWAPDIIRNTLFFVKDDEKHFFDILSVNGEPKARAAEYVQIVVSGSEKIVSDITEVWIEVNIKSEMNPPSYLKTDKNKYNVGENISINWNKPQESNYVLERKINDENYRQIYSGDQNVFEDTALTSGNIVYRVNSTSQDVETLYTNSETIIILPDIRGKLLGGGISKTKPAKFEPKMVFSWDGECKSDYNYTVAIPDINNVAEYTVEPGIKKLKLLITLTYRDENNDGIQNGNDENGYIIYAVINGHNYADDYISDNMKPFYVLKPSSEFTFDVSENDRVAITLATHREEYINSKLDFEINAMTVTHFELWTAE